MKYELCIYIYIKIFEYLILTLHWGSITDLNSYLRYENHPILNFNIGLLFFYDEEDTYFPSSLIRHLPSRINFLCIINIFYGSIYYVSLIAFRLRTNVAERTIHSQKQKGLEASRRFMSYILAVKNLFKINCSPASMNQEIFSSFENIYNMLIVLCEKSN